MPPLSDSPDFPILTSSRLVLNELTIEDQQTLFSIYSDPVVMRHYDMERAQKLEDCTELIAYFSHCFEQGSGIRWAVRDRVSQQLMGTIGLMNISQFEHSATVGFDLARQFWGNGFITEALQTVLQLAFGENSLWQLNRVEALILPLNLASQKVVGNNGFSLEGVLRQKGFWANQYHDLQVHSLLSDEFARSATS